MPTTHPAAPRWRSLAAAGALVATFASGALVAAQGRPGRGPLGGATAGDSGAGLWVCATPLDDGRQLLLVIDPAVKNAAVYHVDGATGTLTLRSTRSIAWDLLVPEYNAQEPRPTALKKLLEAGAETVPTGQDRR